MADNKQLNADRNTQLLTGLSTVERYDYSLENSDLSSVLNYNQVQYDFKYQRRSIELCMDKLRPLNAANVNMSEVDNCFKKLAATIYTYN
jgi:hypothetical protein